jgi:hypothetical protein
VILRGVASARGSSGIVCGDGFPSETADFFTGMECGRLVGRWPAGSGRSERLSAKFGSDVDHSDSYVRGLPLLATPILVFLIAAMARSLLSFFRRWPC